MSFVEGMSVISVDVADPTFVVCVTAAVLLVGLLLAIPAVATIPRFLSLKRGLGKLLWHAFTAVDRDRR
jgi:hypothetical protein